MISQHDLMTQSVRASSPPIPCAQNSIYVVNVSISDNSPFYEAEHIKNRSKKNWDKHTNHRSGVDYGMNRNDKRGNKNKKYIKPENPNRRKRKY